MSEPETQGSGGVSRRAVEIVVALLIIGFAALLILDAQRLGRGWDGDGPQPGFYPFWVGLLMGASALAVIVRELTEGGRSRFVARGRFRPVLVMLVPSLIFVAGIFVIGFYLSAFLYLVCFMVLQGGMRAAAAVPIGLAVPAIAFALFELWFKVPLPKGPIEAMLGF